MSGSGALMADWVGDLRAGIERQLGRTPEAALHWRPAREANSIGDTVWHIARWLDLVVMWLANAAPETQHWIGDGWAARTGYDPRGLGTDGLGAISGYTFSEVEAIPKLAAVDDAVARRYKGVVQGAFGHLGEIAALRALYERHASD